MVELLVLWAGFMIVFTVPTLKALWESQRAVRLMKDGGDLELFVSEMDRLAPKFKDRQSPQVCYLNKSAGLVYLGRWNEAKETLESLSEGDFKSEKFKILYLNNLLYTYLLLAKYCEARRLYAQNEARIVPEGSVSELNHAVFSTIATYRYFFDSPESSRRLFCRLLEQKMDDRAKASLLYFLGRLDLQEGQTELGWSKLERARVCSTGTFVEREVDALKAGRPSIGAPGDGALE